MPRASKPQEVAKVVAPETLGCAREEMSLCLGEFGEHQGSIKKRWETAVLKTRSAVLRRNGY